MQNFASGQIIFSHSQKGVKIVPTRLFHRKTDATKFKGPRWLKQI